MGRGRTIQRGLIRDFESRNGLTHAYRSVFHELCRAMDEPGKRVCAISSAGPGEGRSAAAINLAALAARETGESVLLVDADSDGPSLHTAFDLPAGPGLAEVVREEAALDQAARPVKSHAGLSILTCGDRPLSAVTLAESTRVGDVLQELRGRFGWVFVDTAALLASPGTARLDARADGVVIAVRWSSTRAQLVQQASEKLEAAGARILGVVLTQRHYVIPSYVYRRL
ncbi:MAG: CpsD/CapB family tyrosine-protein kinase [Phycisphaerales bacterium]|nr:CpsD/CapB family tyrosine-protein kinase [Phycisphaerales bacterium]